MTPSYQSLVGELPRFPLATFPSPLQRAGRLEASLRSDGYKSVPRIFLKRDDLLSLAMGGNKTRNLEFLIGEALARGATDVITAGRQQSNHCRLTAAACAKAELRSHVVLSGSEPTTFSGNLLLDRVLGAEIYFTDSEDREDRAAAIQDITRSLQREERVAYVIPVGGSDSRGALGHVLAAGEILSQCHAHSMHEFSVVLATATGGTQAGMVAGFHAAEANVPVLGMVVAKSADELAREIRAVLAAIAADLKISAPPRERVLLDERALGDGYGFPTRDGMQAIERLARTEGILADPVYSGKGLVGLFSMIAEGRLGSDDCVVFVHTGGTPTLFA